MNPEDNKENCLVIRTTYYDTKNDYAGRDSFTRFVNEMKRQYKINISTRQAEGESSDRVTYSVVYEFEDGTSADINGEVYSSRGQAEMEARFGKFAYCMLGKRDEYRDSGCFDTKIVGWKVVQNDTDIVP